MCTSRGGQPPHLKGVRITARSKTSSEVKMRWMKANYKRYQVQLRIDDDADLIKFIDSNKERIGTTELFRLAISKLKDEGI